MFINKIRELFALEQERTRMLELKLKFCREDKLELLDLLHDANDRLTLYEAEKQNQKNQEKAFQS
jgi:hypothetical protein